MSRSAHAALAHHFDDLGQQREAATLGMWLFLVTEVLFFGGLFTTYLVYRNWYPDAFVAASHELVIWAGTVNTAVLITSSLTMALAVRAAQTGDRRQLLISARRDDGARRGISRHQGVRVLHGSSSRTTCPVQALCSTRRTLSTRSFSFRCIF